jgi:serine/threonine-protein kinase SIK3
MHDTEEEVDFLYLFMEYAPGGDLYNYIERNGTLSETQARPIFRQVVSALEFCHLKGIVHHDVKLENSMALFPLF